MTEASLPDKNQINSHMMALPPIEQDREPIGLREALLAFRKLHEQDSRLPEIAKRQNQATLRDLLSWIKHGAMEGSVIVLTEEELVGIVNICGLIAAAQTALAIGQVLLDIEKLEQCIIGTLPLDQGGEPPSLGGGDGGAN